MKIKLLLLLCCGLWGSCSSYDYCPVTPSESDLVFTGLARSWDEAMPLGNATPPCVCHWTGPIYGTCAQ